MPNLRFAFVVYDVVSCYKLSFWKQIKSTFGCQFFPSSQVVPSHQIHATTCSFLATLVHSRKLLVI